MTGAPSSRSSSGRYTHATASHSHSSPNGHVPKPSTYGMWVWSTSASAPAALAHPGRRSTATKSSARSSRPVRRTKSLVEMAGVKRS